MRLKLNREKTLEGASRYMVADHCDNTFRAGKSTTFMYLSKSTSNSEKSYSSKSKSTQQKLYLKYK